MVRVFATFVAVWLAVGSVGVLLQATILPVPNAVVGLARLAIASVGAFVASRRPSQ